MVVVAGLVVGIRTRNANRGGRMAFITLDDRSARMEIRLFSETYEKCRQSIVMDQVLVVQGSLVWDEFSESLRLNAERALDLDTARNEYARRLLIQLEASRFGNGLLDHLAATLAPYRQGNCPVCIDYRGAGAQAEIVFGRDWQVKPAEELLRRLRELVGEEHVQLVYA
jgi:DNA polymerase-3 subunit alpha